MTQLIHKPVRIFISYGRKDSAFTKQLAQSLRQALGSAARVWFDEERADGEVWWSRVVDELTASNICIVVLSDFARHSRYVKAEMRVAWNQKRFNKHFLLIPVMSQEMRRIPPAFDAHPSISFASEPYQAAFDKLLRAMKFELLLASPGEPRANERALAERPTVPLANKSVTSVSASEVLAPAPASQREAWLCIRNEINALLEQSLTELSSRFYHLQGLSYLYADDSQRAQWALAQALELASEPAQRLALLDEYAALFVTQRQWEEVLQQAEEALAIAPLDPIWQFTREEALKRIVTNEQEVMLPL